MWNVICCANISAICLKILAVFLLDHEEAVGIRCVVAMENFVKEKGRKDNSWWLR